MMYTLDNGGMEESMDLVNVRDLFRKQEDYIDQTVTISGWVRSIRNSKNFGFIVVNDGTFLSWFRSYSLMCLRILQRLRN